jgi:hypothetical protein
MPSKAQKSAVQYLPMINCSDPKAQSSLVTRAPKVQFWRICTSEDTQFLFYYFQDFDALDPFNLDQTTHESVKGPYLQDVHISSFSNPAETAQSISCLLFRLSLSPPKDPLPDRLVGGASFLARFLARSAGIRSRRRGWCARLMKRHDRRWSSSCQGTEKEDMLQMLTVTRLSNQGVATEGWQSFVLKTLNNRQAIVDGSSQP